MLPKKSMSKASVLEFPIRRKPQGPYPTDPTPVATGIRASSMLDCTKDSLTYAWLSGSTERKLAEAYQIPRTEVERIVRENVKTRMSQLRRAA